MTEDSWPLVLSWLVSSFLPALAHPILLLLGAQGTGKTTVARTLVSFLDPSPAPVRAEPRNLIDWVVAAAGSWTVVVDNISYIPGWWSDALCRACTGEGLVRRALYTDADISVISLRRAVILSSIDVGTLRGDLGDRVVLVDLAPINPATRRSELEMMSALAADRPKLLGALLDLLTIVLHELPHARLEQQPRMIDFARVLKIVDGARGTNGLVTYLRQRARVMDEVIDGDPVAQAVLTLAMPWRGTAAELLAIITPDRAPRGWPDSPRALSARLARLAPALRVRGIMIERLERSSARREWRISHEQAEEGT